MTQHLYVTALEPLFREQRTFRAKRGEEMSAETLLVFQALVSLGRYLI